MSDSIELRRSALRRRIVLGVFALLGIALVARAAQLQILEHEFYRGEGHRWQIGTVELPAHRGSLLDRRGEPLAVSTPINAVAGNPQQLIERPERLHELAALLGLDGPDLVARVERQAKQGARFMYVKRRVLPALAQQAGELGVPGLQLPREYRRYYPSGPAAAQLLGYTDIDDQGQEGLELAYDGWLQGESGERRVMRDLNKRHVLGVDVGTPAEPGRDLELSIDRQLQYIASRALEDAVEAHDAESASLVMLDTRTGEVLALANYPSFNPNDTGARRGEWQRNRAITDVFEPGSTMKPFTIAAALESGQFTPDSIVHTSPGTYAIGKYEIRDLKDYGWLDLRGVVRKSSNVGISKIAQQLDPEQMWSVFDAFGFGRSPGSEFPGEVAGYFNHPSVWHRVEQASVSYGYGISVSTLHLARAYAALANGGELLPLSFLKLDEAPKGEQVIARDIVAEVTAMLESVVSDGTGHRAGVPGYRVAGKTGTSHRSQGGGYAEDRYLSLFAGFAPVTEPRLACVVVVHDPKAGEHFGSVVAAPVFSRVMEQGLRRFGIEPDDVDSIRASAIGREWRRVADESL